MKEKTGAAQRSRFTLELPCGIERRLGALAEQSGLSKAEVIREAVKLLAEMSELKAQGYSVGASKTHEDGTREIVRIPLDA
jgi:predicted DNA-binding protein